MLTVFTIVLNGEPWIRRILPELQRLAIPWQWRICEGVTNPAGCTAWCRPVPDRWHERGRSIDGTSAWLDEIRADPRIQVFRQAQPYEGKLHMIHTALGTDPHEVVMQMDADELWTAPQITRIYGLLMDRPVATAAKFFCRYFVGPRKVVRTRGGFGSRDYEWLRAWRWGEGLAFASHEPPRLNRPGPVISRDVTQSLGLVFDHMAYATREQAEFKQDFYGYAGLAAAWDQLQATSGQVRLAEYFTFVHDATMVGDA